MTKYHTEEERREARLRQSREKSKRRYYRGKGYAPGQRPRKPRRNEHPSYSMWTNAKKRAKDKGWDFDLVLEELVIPETCPLLGIPIHKGENGYCDNSPTLDRINPKGGYTKDNVWIVSMRANRIKDNATLDELSLITDNLRKRLGFSL